LTDVTLYIIVDSEESLLQRLLLARFKDVVNRKLWILRKPSAARKGTPDLGQTA
jgi:hypothetical protein